MRRSEDFFEGKGIPRRSFLKLLSISSVGLSLRTSFSQPRAYAAETPPGITDHYKVPNEINRLYLATVVQMPLYGFGTKQVTPEMVERNAERTAKIIDKVVASAETTPRLIVLPVLCLTGIGTALKKLGLIPKLKIEDIAVDLTRDPRIDPLRQVCKCHGCYLVSSCVEKVPDLPGRYFHTGFVLGPSGLVLRSPKTQAPTSPGITLLKDFHEEYTDHFGKDAILPVAETPLGSLGCLVESEFLIPEAARALRQKGAEIIVHPTAQHSGNGQPPYQEIRRSLAYTNGVYWLSAVPSREIIESDGKQHQAWFGGGSSIIGPDGSIEAFLQGRAEGLASAQINLDHLSSCRENQARHTQPARIIYQDLYRLP